MSRRLPLCAFCGARLSGAQIRVYFGGLPGAPEVGWHADKAGSNRRRGGRLNCVDHDALLVHLIHHARDANVCGGASDHYLREIYRRGEARVSATRRWKEYLR